MRDHRGRAGQTSGGVGLLSKPETGQTEKGERGGRNTVGGGRPICLPSLRPKERGKRRRREKGFVQLRKQ